jgi:hypothetical protein
MKEGLMANERGIKELARGLRLERFYVTAVGTTALLVNAPPLHAHVPAGIRFMVWDNGGEIGVERINLDPIPRFFPLRWFGVPLGSLEILNRTITAMAGEPITYGDAPLDWAHDYRDGESAFGPERGV